MATRSQKSKAVAELNPGEFETAVTENKQAENLIEGASKSPRVQPEEIKTSLRKKLCLIWQILAENQKEMMKLRSSNVHPCKNKYSYFQNNSGE